MSDYSIFKIYNPDKNPEIERINQEKDYAAVKHDVFIAIFYDHANWFKQFLSNEELYSLRKASASDERLLHDTPLTRKDPKRLLAVLLKMRHAIKTEKNQPTYYVAIGPSSLKINDTEWRIEDRRWDKPPSAVEFIPTKYLSGKEIEFEDAPEFEFGGERFIIKKSSLRQVIETDLGSLIQLCELAIKHGRPLTVYIG